jgi:hypothetical protein
MPVCGPGQSDGGADGAREAKDAFDQGTATLPHVPADLTSSRCYGARPVIRTTRRQCVDLLLQVRDRNGQPIDLHPGEVPPPSSSSGAPSSSSPAPVAPSSSQSSLSSSSGTPPPSAPFIVKFIARDRLNNPTARVCKTCEIQPGHDGYVKVSLSGMDCGFAGIYLADLEVRSYDAPCACLYQSSPYWFVVEPNVNDAFDTGAGQGPITIAEVRLLLRDECAGQNFLLDDVEFDDSQIVMAMTLPIDEFNETNMPRTHFVLRNFPYKFHWRRAVTGYLLDIAAKGYVRNHLDYQAGDVKVADKMKYEAYQAMASQILQEWRRFVVQEKMNINVGHGYGTLRSGYSRVRRI